MYKAEYSVVLYDILTQTRQAVVPCTSLSFENKLGDYGEFTGKLTVNPTTALNGKLWSDVLEVGKTTIYVLRNNKVVWGGVLYEYSISQPSRSLDITGRTFEWVFTKIFQGITKKWSSTDQLTIAKGLLSPALPYYNMTIDSKTSGILRTINTYRYDYKTMFDRVSDLADMINGFEWGVVLSQGSNSTISRNVSFWYPHRGKTKTNTTLSFHYPSESVTAYTYKATLADAATRVWTLGSGEGDEMITARTDKANMTGYPLLEENYSYKSVTSKTTLQKHANTEMKRVEAPIETLEVTVRANNENAPSIGDFEVGDWAKFTFEDWFFQPSFSCFMRIVEYSVDVDDDGLESIDFTLNTERTEAYDDESEPTE